MSAAAAERRSAFVVLALLSLLWGYNWIVMKFGLRYAGPFTFSALRAVFGAALLFGMLAVGGRSLRPVSFRDSLWLGLLQTSGFLGLAQLALVEGGAGRISVLAYTMPFWTVLLAWFLLGERMRPLQWLAVALAGCGLVLILQPWNLQASLLSKTFAVAAGLSWAGSVIVAKRVRARSQPELLSLTAWQLVFGLGPLLLAAWAFDEPPVAWTPGLLGALVFAGAIGTGLGWVMWTYVLHRLPAGTASLNALVIPVIAVLAAWVHLGERPNAVELAGMLVIVVGLGLMSAAAWRQGRKLEPAEAQE